MLEDSGIDVTDLQKELSSIRTDNENTQEKKEVLSNLRKLLRKIENLDAGTEWQRLEQELRDEFDRLEKAQNDLGNDKTAHLVSQLRGQVDEVIRKQDAKLDREILNQVHSLFFHLTMVYQCMGLIQDCNNRFGSIQCKDTSRARQLVNKGLEEINNQPTVERLHPIACELVELLPEGTSIPHGIVQM